MSESPEVLHDEEGKWSRRDVFVQEMVHDHNVEEEAVQENLQEMIDHGPMRSKEVGDAEYIQLKSRVAGATAYAKYKTGHAREQASNRVTSFLGGE